MMRSLQMSLPASLWLTALLTVMLALPAVAAISQSEIEAKAAAKPDFEAVGYIDVNKSGISVPVPRTWFFGRTGTRLHLIQENRLFYVAKTETIEDGEQLSAFEKVDAHGFGNAWVTAEGLLIFGRRTDSVDGIYYLRKGDELPVVEMNDSSYTVLVERNGIYAPLVVPKNARGLAFKPPEQKKRVIEKKTVTKVRSFELTEQGPILKREEIEDPDGALREQAAAQARKARLLEMKSRKVTVLGPEILEEPPPGQTTLVSPEPEQVSAETSQVTPPPKTGTAAEKAKKSKAGKEEKSWIQTTIAKITAFAEGLTSKDKKKEKEKKKPVQIASNTTAPDKDSETRSPTDVPQRPNAEQLKAEPTPVEPEPTQPPSPDVTEQAEPEPERPVQEQPSNQVTVLTLETEPDEQPEAQVDVTSEPTNQVAKVVGREKKGFMGNKVLLWGILLVAVLILAVLLVRMQRDSSRFRTHSEQIETYFTVGESETTDANYFEDLAQESGDFSGSLSGFSIIELINFLNSGQETGTLAVKDDGGGVAGRLYFSAGELVDATYRKKRGEDAVFGLLKSQNASFTFNRTAESKRKKTIEKQTMGLLMEASKQMDEERAL